MVALGHRATRGRRGGCSGVEEGLVLGLLLASSVMLVWTEPDLGRLALGYDETYRWRGLWREWGLIGMVLLWLGGLGAGRWLRRWPELRYGAGLLLAYAQIFIMYYLFAPMGSAIR